MSYGQGYRDGEAFARAVIMAWIEDRREQYRPSSGIYHALCLLLEGLKEGADIAAQKAGELDDIMEREVTKRGEGGGDGE